jgi:Phage tail tube protein
VAAVRRLFGFADDAVAGGSSYDALTSGAIPDATLFWPVSNVAFAPNVGTIDRNAEIRGVRAARPPLPWTARPVVTVQVPAYRTVVEKGAKKTLGGADTRTGVGPASITHAIAALPYGASYPPAVHATVVRDDLYHKVSGCVFERMALTFPLDGEGTCEYELHGLYYANFVTAPPTPVFTGLSTSVLSLRDAEIFIDGAAQAVPDLQGFSFTWVNNTAPKQYAKRNVVTQLIGTPALTRKVWYYHENKLGAAQDVTWSMDLGNVNAAQELARDFLQIQKFVFDVVGDPLGSTPPANELVRVTIYAGAITGGGAGAATARDDITSSFQGGAFYSDADSNDVLFEVVNANATAIT